MQKTVWVSKWQPSSKVQYIWKVGGNAVNAGPKSGVGSMHRFPIWIPCKNSQFYLSNNKVKINKQKRKGECTMGKSVFALQILSLPRSNKRGRCQRAICFESQYPEIHSGECK